MKAYRVRFGGGLESLRRCEADEPRCGAHDVVVRVRAASLNYRDIMILRGRYPLPVQPEPIPCSDGAGDVVEIGRDVRTARVGDRVVNAIFPRWGGGPFRLDRAEQTGGSLDGTLAEFIAIDADAVAKIPDHLSYEEAAAFPCAGLTAWNALTGGGRLAPGSDVLTMGSGGVSLFSLQFGKALGARVIVTTSNDAKAQKLAGLGADDVVDYRAHPDWSDIVRARTNGAGCDLVVELGGAATLAQSMRCVAVDGTVALVGSLAGQAGPLDPSLFAGVFTLRRISVGDLVQFREMMRAVDVCKITPVIWKSFSFDDAPAAFQAYLETDHVGKIVIVVR